MGLSVPKHIDMDYEDLLKFDNGQIVPSLPGFRRTSMPETGNPGVFATACDGRGQRTLDLLLKQLGH